MIKRILKITKSIHGSAIIMALVTTVVLVTLALALITLSMGNLTVNKADALNNKAYYAAESGANSALEQLKHEVLEYYKEMFEADKNEFQDLYDNFFSGVTSNAQSNFMEPKFNGITTETTFTTGDFDSTNNVCEFLISSTATAPDNTRYRVNAKLYVRILDVSQPSWLKIDDVAYKIGGTLTLNSGYGVYNGGNVVTSSLNNPKNQYYYVQPPGQFLIAPGTDATIDDCLTYPSYTDPVIGPPDVYVTVNNTVLGCGSIPTDRPIIIESAPGISFTVGNGTDIYPGSIIYKRGSGTLTLSTSNTDHTITAYSDGDVISKNGPVYANIYARGNVSTSGNFHGNIVCDGSITNTCNTFVGTIICRGSITASGGLNGSFFAEGPININNGLQGNSVIYSKTKVVLGSGNYQSTVIFSGGDVDITGGSSLTGAIIAKGNVNQNSWLTLNYSRTAIQNIMDNPNNSFFFSGGTGGEIEVDGNIIIDQEVKAEGRLQ